MQTYISQNLYDKLEKIFWITIAWTIISILQFFIGFSTLIQLDCLDGGRRPGVYLFGSILTGVFAGLIGGSGVVFLWEGWLRSIPYWRALRNIFLSYLVIYFFVASFNHIYFNSVENDLPFYSAEALHEFAGFFQRGSHWINFIFWLFVVLATLIQLQVNDKYGPGVFRDFLLGRYFTPKREERIFMFLDLRSSTTIAEELGEEKYFNFLNDVFKYATAGILNCKGEIYQYVGDEIVISWRMKRGMENANCVRCFVDIQEALQKKAVYFDKRYGFQPEFKAGLHYGYVMAGEVGVVKRDIAFSGDVLNTTARIQAKCNELGVNILLSEYLLDKLTLPKSTFIPQKIGDMTLRGKQQKVVLYTL